MELVCGDAVGGVVKVLWCGGIEGCHLPLADTSNRQEKNGAWDGSKHQRNIKGSRIQEPDRRSAQHYIINIEESRSQIGTAYHHKYRRIPEPDRRSAQRTTISTEEYRNQIGTTFHSEYRSIQKKVNNAAHTTTKNYFRAQEGGGAGGGPSGYGTLRWPSPCIFPH